jgi:hypothetical protein
VIRKNCEKLDASPKTKFLSLARYKELLAKDLPAFNDMLKQKNIAGIVIPEIR